MTRSMVLWCPRWPADESFEPVAAALDEATPGVEILRPGLAACPARGPARFYGGEEAAAEQLLDAVVALAGEYGADGEQSPAAASLRECQVGIADGLFAGWLAARAGVIVPPGGDAIFLSDVDVAASGRPELVALLRRLGVYTLGAFASLPAADVLDRFGFDAAYVHRLAAGEPPRPTVARKPPPELTVDAECDPPIDRVDAAAFTGRALAEQLQRRLASYGLACTRLIVQATTEGGEQLTRTWRHDGILSAAAVADRVRWQLDGWLTGGSTGDGGARPTGGIVRITLMPDDVIPYSGTQTGLWGEAGEGRDRAHRALTHVQGILGPDAVVTAEPGGGRGQRERTRRVPWDTTDGEPDTSGEPWPGSLPAPNPAVVLSEPLPIELFDATGEAVGVTGRCLLTASPKRVRIGREAPVEVTTWAGPWPIAERWWRSDARRYARLQLGLADGRALLVRIESGVWWMEAGYD